MSSVTFPDFSGGGGGNGGGGGPVSYPLTGPPGAAGAETFGFTTGGGLHGTSAGEVALSVANGDDGVVVTAQGDVRIPQQLQVIGLASLLGGLSASTIAATSITTTGNVGVGGSLGVQGSAQLTGDLSARKVTASSDLSAASLSTAGAIAGGSLTITGAVTLGSLRVGGTFRASQIESDGALLFPVSDSSMPGLGLGEQPSTGVFAITDTLGLTVAGNRVVSFAKNLTADFAGALKAGAITADSLTAHNLAIDTASSLQSLTVTTLMASGLAQLQGGLTVANGLTVTGTTRLADLRIDLLSTDHDLSVGEDATIAGTLQVQGATTLAGLTAGTTAVGGLTAGRTIVQSAYMLGGPPTYVPVRQEAIPNQPGTIDYVMTLDPGGSLAIAGTFLAGKDATLLGALSVAGAATASSAHITGAIVGDATATFAGLLAAPASRIGGSTFSAASGQPSGQVTGSVGDLYVDRSSGLLYLKVSGQATQAGWIPVTTSGSSLSFPLAAPASSPADGPSYAFATSAGDGLGSEAAGSLYLAVGNNTALDIASDGTVTIGGDLEAFSANVANLSARGLSVQFDAQIGGQLTADSATIANQVSGGSLWTSGLVTAGSTAFGSLECTGNGHLGGSLTVDAAISAGEPITTPAAVLNGARVSSGTGSPNGSVSGSPGDAYLDRSLGDLWLKATGSATTSGWARVSTSAAGTTFPLSAPDGSAAAPSYGFSQGGLGLTATGTQVLAGITNGTVGWTLGPDQAFAAKAAFSVAGASTLAALSATTGAFSGQLSAAGLTGGTLNVSGASSLAALTAAATTVSSLSSQAGIAAATSVTIAGTAITPGSAQPSASTGQQGDLAPTTSGSVPLYVRGSSAWRAVALVGDPAPTSFPLRGPADSAASPNFSFAASPSSGLFSPGPNQLGFVTNGTQAGSISASQAWTLAGPLTAGAATFPSATVNGALSATGNVTVGGTLGVTGAVTLASSLTGGDIVSSGQLTAQAATVNGALSAQTATTSGDVTIGGSLTVNGTTTYAGIQRSGYIQTGDGTVSAPAVAFTSEPGLGSWRPAAATYAIAAGGANLVTITAALATFAGAIRVGNTNAGFFSSNTNTLALQTGGTTALAIASNQAASFSSTVLAPGGSASSAAYGVGNGTYGFFGYNNSGAIVPAVTAGGQTVATFFRGQAANNYAVFGIGLGDIASPTPSPTGGQGGLFGSSTPPNGQWVGTAGALYAHWAGGGTTPALYVCETPAGSSSNSNWQRVLTTSSAIVPTYPAVGPAGSAASPTFQAGSGNGIYGGTDGLGRAILGLAQGSSSVGRLATFTNNSLPVWLFGLGDAASSSVSGGLLASAQVPATGAPAGLPGMVYQYLGGGAGQSLWVNESTTSTPSWVKVLTTSSSVQASFPSLANPDGSVTAPSYSWASETGLGWYRSAAATMVAVGAGAPLATLTTNLLTLPGALRVGGTNAGLTSSGANALVLQTAGTAALSISSAGVSSFGFQLIATGGTAALPGLAVGVNSTGMWAGQDAFATGIAAISVAANPVAIFKNITVNSLPVYISALGSAASSTVNGGIMASGQSPTGVVNAFPSQLYQDTRGGPGCLYVFEGTSNGVAAWAKVLTATTATATLSLSQGSIPTATANVTKLWADTSGNLGVVSSQGAAAGQTQYIRVDGQANVLSSNVTLTAAANGATIVASAATAYTVTLPSSTTYDLRFYFQVETTAGVTIAAASGQLINIGGTVSSSGGSVSTTTVGATLELFLRANVSTWFARSSQGTFILA